ncbi:MAG: ADP-ribosylglycohydrolase family protein, partial [bacterium]
MARTNNFRALSEEFADWLILKQEEGADTGEIESEAWSAVLSWIGKTESISPDATFIENEPNDLETIRALRPKGKRRYPLNLSEDALYDKILGAWLGRAAGCILGLPCESMSKEEIRVACKALGQRYPLNGYWEHDPKPHDAATIHYGVTPRKNFLRKNLRRIGTDDDLTYTLLGLLILEEYGIDFTSQDVGRAWVQYLPVACTAERVVLDNLRRGLEPPDTAMRGNTYRHWIGAAIRSDPWGYAAPGWPEKAAELAYRDAIISHRGPGLHDAMYFSAVIALAFVVDDPVEACRLGLKEIPKDCWVSRTVKETLRWCERDCDWDTTTNRILRKYKGMSGVHCINNAALTIAGLYYGRKNFGRTIELTVMGGLDTDCTAATAGSILGAVLGAKRIPKKWIDPLGSTAESYLIGKRIWRSDSI